ncbi:HAD family hydrolase [Actinoplanes missouriensis]|uniref:HAD family hydrolase n=1 Tax=Actinoplanes missouriensis TaxID=1866 RepID=UPI0033DC25EE
MTDRKLFVWDLHGTLECGNELAVIHLSNEVLAYRGFTERFRENQAISLYGLKWWQYFRSLLPEQESHIWHALQDECFRLSEQDLKIQAACMTPAPYSHEVLREIGERHDQILISNTRPANLRGFMDKLGLCAFFPDGRYFAVDGHTDMKATKEQVIDDYLASHPPYDEIVVIGDSSTDMRLGKHVGGVRVLYNHEYLPRKEAPADVYTSDLRTVLKFM